MRPLRLALQGITRFADRVELDLSGVPPGLVALVGPNGAGKSTLLEALGPLALYLEAPSYPGTFTSLCQDGRRDNRLELDVEWGGRTYSHVVTADRGLRGSQGQTQAWLYEGGRPVGGSQGRVGDYHQAVASIYPPQSLFLAAAFGSQLRVGSWFGLSTAQRRELFGTLLGLGELQHQADRAGEVANALRLEARVASETMARTWGAAPPDIPALEATLAQAERGVVATAADRDADRAEADALAAAAWDAPPPELAADVAAAAAALEERAEATRLAREGQAAAAAALAAWQVSVRHRRDVLAWRATLAERARQRAEMQAQLEALGPAVDPAAAAREAGLAAEALSRHRAAVQQRHRDEEQAREILTVPCGARTLEGIACGSCRLLAQAVAAQGRLDEPWDGTLGPFLEGRAASTAEAASTAQRIATDRARLVGRLALLPEPDAAELERATDPGDPGPAPEPWPGAAALEAAVAAQEAAALALATAKRREAAWLARRQEQHRTALAQAQARARESQAAHQLAVAAVERARAALGTARAAATARQAAEAEAQAVRDALPGWDALTRALGPTGAQALEIDRAGPGVSDLVNRLLATVFGGRFQAVLRTLQEAGRGRKAREVFDLQVLDGEGPAEPRDAALYSGGQRVLIEEALRLALVVYSRQRSALHLDTLWRDEVDGALQESLAAAYPAMLRGAMELGGYRNVYLISHREAVWTQADTVIRVEGGAAWVE